MKKYVWISRSSEETQRLAEKMAPLLQPGDVIALEGDLGAGKTTFTQGLARGLGITQVVNSPTFTLIKEYAGRIPLYHMDVYRLEEEGEDLGFDEYFYGDGVTVVEWPSRIREALPPERLQVRIVKEGAEPLPETMREPGRRALPTAAPEAARGAEEEGVWAAGAGATAQAVRKLEFIPFGERYRRVCEELMKP
ncbi:tRNA (adenosine(37)-N6)-threonylcarbamoyltransferase complex ATPase subunit type 1 TsaE [Bacillaceae bacterium]